MKKSDLKTGYIVQTRNGETALVVKDNCYGKDAIIFRENSWTPLDGFAENLIWHYDDKERSSFASNIDIMKVFKPDLPTGFLSRKSKFSHEMELLWERREEKLVITIDGVDYSGSTLRSLIEKAMKL